MARVQRLYASCDFMLMPSLAEPCRLNPLIAMHYEALPIVSQTGGLRDTVTDVWQDPEDGGTGLALGRLTPEELSQTIEHSIAWLSSDPLSVHMARRRAMAMDWLWRRTASEYVAVFQAILQ